MSNLNPITRKEAILNGDDITPVTREEYFTKNAVSGGGSFPAPTSEDVGKVLTVAEDAEHTVTTGWQNIGEAYSLSNTVSTAVQTLIGDVITDILTNSKTVPVMKRSTLTHSGVADDIAILRSAAEAFMSGRQVATPVAADTLARAVQAYLGEAVEIQFFIPNFGQNIPSVGDRVFTVSLQFFGGSDESSDYVSVAVTLQAITDIS